MYYNFFIRTRMHINKEDKHADRFNEVSDFNGPEKF